MGTYRHLSHMQFSVAHFLVSTLLSKMFDVGDRDLPVLTSGNWVIKGWVIKRPVKLRMFFYVFFSKSKKTWLFTFFEWLTTFSRTLVVRMREISTIAWEREIDLKCVSLMPNTWDFTGLYNTNKDSWKYSRAEPTSQTSQFWSHARKFLVPNRAAFYFINYNFCELH